MAVKQDSDMSMSESSDSEAISSTPAYLELLHDFLSSVSLSQAVADELTKYDHYQTVYYRPFLCVKILIMHLLFFLNVFTGKS